MADQVRICTLCGVRFVLTSEEEEWLRQRATARGKVFCWPRRCHQCQAQANVQRNGPAYRVSHCWRCAEPFSLGPELTEPALCRCCYEISLPKEEEQCQ